MKVLILLSGIFIEIQTTWELSLYFVFAFIFLLEDNWFTTLCWPLPYINMNQPQVHTCLLPPEPPSHLLPHPTPLGFPGTLGWVLCVKQQIPTGYLFYILFVISHRMHYCFSGYIANWWVKKRLWEKPTLMCFYPHGTVDNSVHIQCLLSYVVPLLLQSHAAWRPAQLMDSAALPSWLLLTGVK